MSDVVKQQPTFVDINDLSLQAESLTVNPEGDAFEGPPPAPQGIYPFKAKHQKEGKERWEKRHSEKKSKDFLMTAIELRIIAPGQRFDNNPVFDRASTLIMESSGTCRVAGILGVNKIEVPRNVTDVQLAQALTEFLTPEPTVRAEVDWKGYCEVCDKDVLKTMRKFPEVKGQPGVHKHTTQCSKCGTRISAQLYVVRYLPVVESASA